MYYYKIAVQADLPSTMGSVWGLCLINDPLNSPIASAFGLLDNHLFQPLLRCRATKMTFIALAKYMAHGKHFPILCYASGNVSRRNFHVSKF